MKILFLDVDGVLNDEQTCKRATWKDDRTFFRPLYVERVNRILAATGAKLVISSSWRVRYSTLEELKAAFHKFGFDPDLVIDKTPTGYRSRRMSETMYRGLEIQHWLSDNAENHDVESIVILDDDQDMLHLDHRLIRTEGFRVPLDGGISEAQVAEAIALFNTPDDVHKRFDWDQFVDNRQAHLNYLKDKS